MAAQHIKFLEIKQQKHVIPDVEQSSSTVISSLNQQSSKNNNHENIKEIQRRRCSAPSFQTPELTAQELLMSNPDFLFMPTITSRKTLSPYEIETNPPFLNDVNSNTIGIVEKDKIGVNNFDPRIPIVFTEFLTLKAIENLGILAADLFFPTKTILNKIDGDKKYFENLLIERALLYADNVRKERNKIILELSKSQIITNSSNSSSRGTIQSYSQKHRSHSENVNAPGVKRPMTSFQTFSRRNETYHSKSPPSTSELPGAMVRSKQITENQIAEKKRLVEEIEQRHSKILQELENEKNMTLMKVREANEQKRLKSQKFNIKIREEHIQRIEAYEKKNAPVPPANARKSVQIEPKKMETFMNNK